MALSKEDLEQIAEAIKKGIDDKHAALWVEAGQHYLDHQQLAECRATKSEWTKNHEFVSSLRSSADMVKKVTLRTAVGLLVTAFIGWILYSFGMTIGKQ